MTPKKPMNGGKDKRVTRYTYEKVMEPRTPETGHTALLPADEQVVTVPMDNGWSKAIKVGQLPSDDPLSWIWTLLLTRRSFGPASGVGAKFLFSHCNETKLFPSHALPKSLTVPARRRWRKHLR